jgi:hypothetical protein
MLAAPEGDIELLDSQAMSANTANKPQSKVWTHDGQWWSVFADSAGIGVWRLDGTAWTKVLPLRNGAYYADVKPAGDLVHILLEKDTKSLLTTVEYVDGAPGVYVPWSANGELIPLPLTSSTETATLDIDSTGRLWVAYDTTNQIQVIHSTSPYTTWSAPVVLASNVQTDDIAAIAALPSGQMGVMWSNQITQRFGFRTHDDSAPPDQWSADEVPASQSALNAGSGMADDHLNLTVATDGTLYAAVKTSYNQAALPSIALLVRRPTGQWDDLYEVDTHGTRGIVQISESQDRLLVIYRAENSEGPIVYKESLLSSIAFAPRLTLLDDLTLSNPSGSKDPFDNEMVVIASGSGLLTGARVTYGERSNQPPVVSAGVDQSVLVSQPAALDGTVVDDGLPNPPNAVTTTWTAISGPGTVSFGDAGAIDTTASFSQTGRYELRLLASDGELAAFDDVIIDVTSGQPVTQSFEDGVASYAGTTDTRLVEREPNTNFGTIRTITVDATPPSASLLRWDISTIPASSTILSATISLTVNVTSQHAFEIYQVKRAWSETQATWNQAAAGVPWGQPGAAAGTDRGSAVLGLATGAAEGRNTIELNADGLAAIQLWVSNPSLNHGFIIQNYNNATDALGFRSRESGISTRPVVTISYLPPGGAASTATSFAKDGATTKSAESRRPRLLSSNLQQGDMFDQPGSIVAAVKENVQPAPRTRAGFDGLGRPSYTTTQPGTISRNWVALRIARATLVDKLMAEEDSWSDFGRSRSPASIAHRT